jgi:hypothetical protein
MCESEGVFELGVTRMSGSGVEGKMPHVQMEDTITIRWCADMMIPRAFL